MRFRPDRGTIMAFCLGLASVALSLSLLYVSCDAAGIVIRDVLQVSLVGVVIPFLLLSRREGDFGESGLRFDRPLRYLAISTILGALLLVQFILQNPSKLRGLTWWGSTVPASYVVVANVFEVIFFVIYLRSRFERAFGILPAIALAATFYSFHHAGFQPEFLKLFLVGILFTSIFRMANHWLILFPLWWVGGVCDVLLGAEEIADISRIQWWRTLIILIPLVLMLCLKYPAGALGTKKA